MFRRDFGPSQLFSNLSHLKRLLAMPKAKHALMCAEQIATELTATNDLVVSQVAVGMRRSDVVEALFMSWKQRFQSMSKCSDAEKTIMTNALRGGPWSDEQRSDLARFIFMSSCQAVANDRRKR